MVGYGQEVLSHNFERPDEPAAHRVFFNVEEHVSDAKHGVDPKKLFSNDGGGEDGACCVTQFKNKSNHKSCLDVTFTHPHQNTYWVVSGSVLRFLFRCPNKYSIGLVSGVYGVLNSKMCPVRSMLFFRRREQWMVALSMKTTIFLTCSPRLSASACSLPKVSMINCSTIVASTDPSNTLLVMTQSVVIAESRVSVKTFCLVALLSPNKPRTLLMLLLAGLRDITLSSYSSGSRLAMVVSTC